MNDTRLVRVHADEPRYLIDELMERRLEAGRREREVWKQRHERRGRQGGAEEPRSQKAASVPTSP
jgi:hypothetical protein